MIKKIIFILVFFPLLAIGQTLDNYNLDYLTKIYADIEDDNLVYEKDAEMEMNKILTIVGNPKRFVVKSDTHVNNALATSYNGIRYILFNKTFIADITNSTQNYWSNTFILAHEVGHHLSQHLLETNNGNGIALETKRQQELEADEFAGFILSKLGASLEQTSETIAILTDDADDSFSDHPSKTKRLAAIEIGFNNAMSNDSSQYIRAKSELTFEDYFYSAVSKYKNQDFNGALKDYSSAIALKPNSFFYYNRGVVKSDLQDYRGAVSDYTDAIALNPKSYIFYNRGISKYKLNDYKGAILDYNKAISLNPNYGKAYYNRGLSKSILQDNQGAISDYTNAISLKSNLVDSYYNRGSVKDDLNDFSGAIADFTKAIEFNPTFSKAYVNRGNSKNTIKDYGGAIVDLTKAIALNPKSKIAYSNRGLAKFNSRNYQGAILDFTEAITIDPDDSDSYYYRGNAKMILNQKASGCSDFKKAAQLGNQEVNDLIVKYCK